MAFGQNEEIKDLTQLFKERKFQEVIDVLSSEDEKRELSLDELFYLTKSYGRTGQYSNGLIYAEKMKNICLAQKDTTNLVRALNLKAENVIDLGRYEVGVKFCKEASTVFRPQDSLEYQKLCFKWGMMLYHTEQYKEAYEVYNKITHKPYRKLTLFTNNYALTLMGIEKWNEAIKYLKESVSTDINSDKNISINLSNMAHVYMNLKQWKQAEIHLDSAVRSLKSDNNLTARKAIYKNYFELFKKQNKIDKAMFTLDEIEKINQDIFNQKVNEKIQALESANNSKVSLTKKVKVIDDQLQVSQRQTLWGAVISLLLIIGLLTTLFIYKYRNIMAAHENVLVEQKLLRSQMTPHFIFNSLSVLQGMILNKEDRKAVSYLSKFSKLLRLILENSREKLVRLEDELNAVQHYADLQNMRSQNQFIYTLTFKNKLPSQNILIPPMLIQPFVENAIEHGFKKNFANAKIDVDILFKDDQLTCIISDNGIGVDADSNKTNNKKKSLATKITSERLKIISREFKMESGVHVQDRKIFNEKGTLVTLKLPYKIDKDA
ncbi:histidine kinase [Aureibaculum sp. A20]|uniref:Histidine kinase n=1 Tax=Aureibaculum flavum TaxID=2795986 RepID=A0ABS0WS98_9FLAO|nr:histidine kinase [Aureibaculum flavum]MBJ2174838.1 histidine kinase [Aureibaculum flavum]